MSAVAPNGCRYCGVGKPEHLQRWDAQYRAETGNGWHQWIAPTSDQTRDRMVARRAALTPASDFTPKG